MSLKERFIALVRTSLPDFLECEGDLSLMMVLRREHMGRKDHQILETCNCSPVCP